MAKGGARSDDDEKALCMIAGAILVALTIWLGGGILNLMFATCATGECADGACWWGCDCGYYSSDSPASGVVGTVGMNAPPAPPQAEPVLCSNTCSRYDYDGDCDDGRAGSYSSLCSLGTDCYDCGETGGESGSSIDSDIAYGSSSQCPAGHLCSGIGARSVGLRERRVL
eukprot:COSAG06_NODE_15040_length_1102_cov_0.988036_1_plen_169_part_01